jgi:hypothetical protein
VVTESGSATEENRLVSGAKLPLIETLTVETPGVGKFAVIAGGAITLPVSKVLVRVWLTIVCTFAWVQLAAFTEYNEQ